MVGPEVWSHVSGRIIFLRKLYPNFPTFNPFQLYELKLSPYGPALTIVAHTFEMPVEIPPKWGSINRAEIEIVFFGLLDISIGKFSRLNMCYIDISLDNNIFETSISGDTIAEYKCEFVTIGRISGYWRE